MKTLYIVSNAHCPEHCGPIRAEAPDKAAVIFATHQGLLDDPDTWAHVTVRRPAPHADTPRLFEVRREVTCTEIKSDTHSIETTR